MIRGDKVLSFEGLYALCKHYRISVDSYCGIASNKVVLDCRNVDPESFCVIDWLRFVLPERNEFGDSKSGKTDTLSFNKNSNNLRLIFIGENQISLFLIIRIRPFFLG